MNRFTAQGLAFAAMQGERILVLTATNSASGHALRAFDDVAHDPIRVRRANGNQSIEYPTGGRIDFRSAKGGGYRGMTSDVVYLDEGVTHQEARDAAPCIANGGTMVQA